MAEKAQTSGVEAAQAARQAGQATEDAKTVIRLLVTENPKRGKSRARYALYKDGMTVAQYIEQGGFRADLKWDTHPKRAFIRLEPRK